MSTRIPRRLAPLRLDRIQNFLAVIDNGGFSAAADAEYVSQPHVSRHVAEIEQALGVVLLDRTSRPISLTREGEAIEPILRGIVESLAGLSDVVDQLSGEVRGTVNLGTYPGATSHLFPRVATFLRDVWPGVEVVIWESMPHELVPALTSGRFDIVVHALPPGAEAETDVSTQLWTEPIVAVLRPGDALSSRSSLSIRDLEDLPLITIGNPSFAVSSQAEITAAFELAGIAPNVAMRTAVPETLASMVASGMGIGVTNLLTSRAAAVENLIVVPIDTHEAERTVVATWRRTGGAPSQAVAAVLSALQSVPFPS